MDLLQEVSFWVTMILFGVAIYALMEDYVIHWEPYQRWRANRIAQDAFRKSVKYDHR